MGSEKEKDRPMTLISLRLPRDTIADLKRVAPLVGQAGYQPLIRAYIAEGLRQDMERFQDEIGLAKLLDSLRQHGVDEGVLTAALAEAGMANGSAA